MGLSESKLASELGVSRQIISNWMKKEKFPRPEKLLKLSKILKMSFNEMVIRKESVTEPVVAFRKKGGHKIPPDYLENAKHMGTLLEQLVSYPKQEKNIIHERPDMAREIHQRLIKFMEETNVPSTRIKERGNMEI